MLMAILSVFLNMHYYQYKFLGWKGRSILLMDTYSYTLLLRKFSELIINTLLSRIIGQGYDGASNMRGMFGGLRTLIQNDNSYAYYVHCFTYQLQLELVACAKNHKDFYAFFGKVNMFVNFIRSSNKRRELLQDKHVSQFSKLIEEG